MTTMAADFAPRVRADDVLAAILALAERASGKHLEVRAHDSNLQKIFRDLVKRFDYLRPHFVFSDSGPELYSPTLNESFARLQLAGLIGRQNPDYEVMFLRPAAMEYYSQMLEPKLDAEAKKALDEIAKAFVQSISINR